MLVGSGAVKSRKKEKKHVRERPSRMGPRSKHGEKWVSKTGFGQFGRSNTDKRHESKLLGSS